VTSHLSNKERLTKISHPRDKRPFRHKQIKKKKERKHCTQEESVLRFQMESLLLDYLKIIKARSLKRTSV
jgi:hypothetical protein